MDAPDYQKTISVPASADAVFDAITTASGLTAWWTPTTGSGGTGGELELSMNAPDPLRIHVDEATRPSSVEWTVTECAFMPDWVGTRPTFTITPVDGGSCEVEFRHRGLTAELDCIDMCTSGWNHFIVSLRDYAATGHGSPNGSPADQARRLADADPR
jgi:uncharacterized protein YndB with AHSA1/START domain